MRQAMRQAMNQAMQQSMQRALISSKIACTIFVFIAAVVCENTTNGQGQDQALKLDQKKPGTDVEIVAHVYHPALVPATDERIASLKVPDGFVVRKWAENLGNPRMIAVHDSGTVYVTRREQKDVVMLKDTDGDFVADVQKTVATREPMLHGIEIRDNAVYLTTVKEVFSAEIRPDGSFGSLNLILDKLPDGGQHPNRTLEFGPDGYLYVSVGSASNAAPEPNPEHATILKADPRNG